jgi:hypothetical protein
VRHCAGVTASSIAGWLPAAAMNCDTSTRLSAVTTYFAVDGSST